jgi:hypothetical protein
VEPLSDPACGVEICSHRPKRPTKNYREFVMPHIPDKAAFQNSLASLPLVTYQAGETVIVGGSKTDQLLILKTTVGFQQETRIQSRGPCGGG